LLFETLLKDLRGQPLEVWLNQLKSLHPHSRDAGKYGVVFFFKMSSVVA
jgi:hypothetical protein